MSTSLIIVGDSIHAQIACEYFRYDSDYIPVAFAVPAALRKTQTLLQLPVIDFEEMEKAYSPSKYLAHVAIASSQLNRNRQLMYDETKQKGYKLANYISSKAFVWDNGFSTVSLGDNNFIYENNVIQPFCKLGSNNILWSGNHFGHNSVLGDHCFIASHVVVSGYCSIGNYSFVGVNATVGNNISIGENCIIGAGALIMKNVPDNTQVKGKAPEFDTINTLEKFGLK